MNLFYRGFLRKCQLLQANKEIGYGHVRYWLRGRRKPSLAGDLCNFSWVKREMDNYINSLLRDVDDKLLECGLGVLSQLTRENLASALYDTTLSRRAEIVGIDIDESDSSIGVTLAIKMPHIFVSIPTKVVASKKETVS